MKTLTRIMLAVLLCAFSIVSANEAEQGEFKKTLKVGKSGFLELYVSMGSIQIVPWDKNEMQIEARGIYDGDADKVKITQTGNIVKVSYEQGGHPDEVKFIISLPAQHNVRLSTSSGDIEVNGTLKGELRGSTSGGDIKLGKVDGLVALNTSGGNISSGDVVGNASFNTSGGDISVGSVAGTAQINTNGGDITVKSVGEKLSATTYGGDIQIGSIEGDGKITTYGGDIHIDNVSGSAEVNTYGGDIFLSGASGKVKASTQGGDITLSKISGPVDAQTRSGSIMLEMLSAGNDKSKVVASNGDITLYLKDDIKATVNANLRMRGWNKNNHQPFSIHSDFDAAQKPEYDDNKGEVRISLPVNGGGQQIYLETVNADINIKKLSNKKK
ncbi:MAG: DUF4097 domain-containing protein [Ignavibacteria bacterium]|nr:DUF4097 domain-containing protein [Ignavibacteria bacterium]